MPNSVSATCSWNIAVTSPNVVRITPSSWVGNGARKFLQRSGAARPEATTNEMCMNAEQRRLNEAREQAVPWRKWGPYVSARQWGTVREDYSENGNAWDYFTHDQARSRAYRWGEDGLAGISDDQQQLCFALTLWNGKDAILKERLFGLTNSEGNHRSEERRVGKE